jgi:hypothetical protein
MNIKEIITNPPRDEYIDNYQPLFDKAPVITTIRGLELKKLSSPTEIEYGLFDKNNLVGYMSLDYHGNDIWEVRLVQLAQAFKGMGYGTFLYDYAVMNDKYKIISDATNTEGKHGSVELWRRLRSNSRYEIVGYDTVTKQIIPNASDKDIYDNKVNTRWLALPPNKTINESLEYIQGHMKKRYVVWYGPGTTTPDYFNY